MKYNFKKLMRTLLICECLILAEMEISDLQFLDYI